MRINRMLSALAVLPMLASTAQAADPAAGEEDFRRCKSCHAIVDDEGNAIQKGGRTGPNLYGVIGRPVAGVEDFRYGDSLAAAGEEGLVWDEENLAAYITDPKAWLQEVLDEDRVRTKMTYKHRKGADDMAAYLASLGS
ncbi:cytochrome C [Psychromarinibacter sp. C21-152]|uniref:Cytochrome C n=1 Tax=Psychromarinibacter sediminicola TaxID=3033385 RepID=A0AAE3NVH4_9RHOB|nr:cytochrome C [Psychromarinibacter sediminicola]MDF0602429.1 cytochrome C [Psychromarinibacter sediminicola]